MLTRVRVTRCPGSESVPGSPTVCCLTSVLRVAGRAEVQTRPCRRGFFLGLPGPRQLGPGALTRATEGSSESVRIGAQVAAQLHGRGAAEKSELITLPTPSQVPRCNQHEVTLKSIFKSSLACGSSVMRAARSLSLSARPQ